MTDFLSRFKAVVTALQQDPQVEVFHFAIAPPRPDAIQQVESALGHALDPAIVDFYTACDGVQLLWIRKDNKGYEDCQNFIRGYPFNAFIKNPWFPTWNCGEMDFTPDGIIWIPSITDVFLVNLAEDYGYDFSLDDFHASLTHGYAGFSVQPFDYCHYSQQLCFLMNGTPNPYLMLAEDHMACLEGPAISFEDYLEVLLLCKGEVKPRLSRAFLGEYVPSDRLKILSKGDFVSA
jgi:hypothetical protein